MKSESYAASVVLRKSEGLTPWSMPCGSPSESEVLDFKMGNDLIGSQAQ